jgi:hydrogenase nickel incorporation protein HypA/HybF
MHEMSLAEGVLKIVEDAARAQGLARVTEVRLEIGKLSAVEPEALRFCLGLVFKDSLAAQATIELIESPGRGVCLDCHAEVEVTALFDPCPRCGSTAVQVTGGREMRVKDLLAE